MTKTKSINMKNILRTSVATPSGILLSVLLALAGPAAAADQIDAGRGNVPITVPSGYSAGTPVPLIVLLHSFGRSGPGQDEYLKVSALANEYGFILATPDGTPSSTDKFGMKVPRYWNASDACCAWAGPKVDDSAYISGLIDRISKKYTVDAKRIFLYGHSNGAFMSYRMAHEHSDKIAAFASLAGADAAESTAPPNPVHVLQIHGTADEAIAYAGGGTESGTYPGAKQSVASWAAHNGCAAEGKDVGTLDLDRGLTGAETTVTRFTEGCKPGGSAELWTLAEGKHGPQISEHFSRLVIEWLLAHPKP